jgi:small subunit ribosomal protein S9
MSKEERWCATGRRKNASARVSILKGTGKITINDREVNVYFGRKVLTMIVNQPFELTSTQGQFDVMVNVIGGGISGQASAIKHGISRALTRFDLKLRPVLKSHGFLRRDSRAVERQKYGQRGARARFQYSKR